MYLWAPSVPLLQVIRWTLFYPQFTSLFNDYRLLKIQAENSSIGLYGWKNFHFNFVLVAHNCRIILKHWRKISDVEIRAGKVVQSWQSVTECMVSRKVQRSIRGSPWWFIDTSSAIFCFQSFEVQRNLKPKKARYDKFYSREQTFT